MELGDYGGGDMSRAGQLVNQILPTHPQKIRARTSLTRQLERLARMEAFVDEGLQYSTKVVDVASLEQRAARNLFLHLGSVLIRISKMPKSRLS